MGQTLRKATARWKSQTPRPPRPGPRTSNHGDEAREWDRSDPIYKVMIQEIAGNVVNKPGGIQGSGQGGLHKRPLPTNRHSTFGAKEDSIVAPGTLNVAHIRQMFLLYQGLAEGEKKTMDARALAEKYNVDFALLQKVLQFYAIPEKRNGSKTVTSDVGLKSMQE